MSSAFADWVDASADADGSNRVALADLGAALTGIGRAARRYFGPGDVLRNAALEFGDKTSVEIESRFENCSVVLGEGTELVIGQSGVLKDCQIKGGGNMTVHGSFLEKQSPGISGVKRLSVSAKGAVSSVVVQAQEGTAFAFEPGCRLRLKISRQR